MTSLTPKQKKDLRAYLLHERHKAKIPEFENMVLICPTCKKESKLERWETCYVSCDDCGYHEGISCPECKAEFDIVLGYDEILEELK